MAKTHCITHPASAEIVIIREDYLAICDKNHCAAALLNIFEYWTDIKLGERDQKNAENEIRMAGSEAPLESDLWIYKSIPGLRKELMGLFGISKIGKALELLQTKGFIATRNNPKYGWDRTLQYELQTEVVQNAVHTLKITHGSVKNKGSKASKTTDASVKNNAAIPETTTETTTKNGSRKRDPYFDAISEIFKSSAGGYVGNLKAMMLGTSKRGEWKRCNFDPPVVDAAEIRDFGIYMRKRMAEKNLTDPPSACVTIQRWFYDFRDEMVRKAARKITPLDPAQDLSILVPFDAPLDRFLKEQEDAS